MGSRRASNFGKEIQKMTKLSVYFFTKTAYTSVKM